MQKYLLVFLTIVIVFSLIVACKKQASAPYDSEIYLVRHFQKQAPTPASGKDVNLTKAGERNANGLAEHLQDKLIQTIYSTNYNRTKQTAEPSSQTLDILVSIYDPQSLKPFAEQLLDVDHNQLVVGHSNTTGVLFGLLGCETVALTEKDYGDIFVVKRSHSQTGVTISACVRYKLALNTLDINKLKLVKQVDLRKYWIQSNVQFSFDSTYSNKSAPNSDENISSYPRQDGIVEVGFIIDVNGKTSNFETLQSQPTSLWEAQALDAAKQLRFSMAESRKEQAKPIYTTWIFTFTAT
ncbi:MAG: TonB family protein [Alphaproteobacteria bacterium]|jgi:TonB family protein